MCVLTPRALTSPSSDARRRPPLPIVGCLFEPLYRAVVAKRNRAFDREQGVTRFDVPVISVGNLSVGGTGKTPMVRTLVEMLRARGRTPAIAMRGYKANPGERSDEEAEYHDALGDVPIVAQPDRTAGIPEHLRTNNAIDCVVLDDGFQHRYVARDLDIVLIDATRSPFEDRCLPAGWLREPVDALHRASMIVLTRSDLASTARLEGHLARYELPLAKATHAWTGLTRGDDSVVDPSELTQRSVIIACAIGHPSAFVVQCERAGCVIEDVVIRPDHHDWSASETHKLEHAALACDGLVITTGKDWVKLRQHARTPLRFVRPALTLTIDDEGLTALSGALDRVLG